MPSPKMTVSVTLVMHLWPVLLVTFLLMIFGPYFILPHIKEKLERKIFFNRSRKSWPYPITYYDFVLFQSAFFSDFFAQRFFLLKSKKEIQNVLPQRTKAFFYIVTVSEIITISFFVILIYEMIKDSWPVS